MHPFNKSAITAYGDYLSHGFYTFHSGFEHIDNFVNQNGDFISLADDVSFLAPNSIIISDFMSGNYSQVVIGDDFAQINNQKYILNKKLQQNSSFIYPAIAYSTLVDKINAFINMQASDFPPKSLFFLLHPENNINFTSAFEKAFMQQLNYAYSLFSTQLYESIKAFKSRGSGLTPSGDDFIAGVLFGLDFLEKTTGISFNKMKNNIYEIGKSNNIFSNNMLRMAYHAKYFKRLQDFLNAFFYLPLGNISPAFKQLIAVGDTSGADLLTGFLVVIMKRSVQ